MNRGIKYELEGRSAMLLLSIYAVKKISARFGSLEEFGEKIAKMPPVEQMSELLQTVALLSEAGAKYNELQGEEPTHIFTAEELEILLPLNNDNLTELSNAVKDAFTAGSANTIEAKTDSKNLKTAE